jgi:hypothetical protein
LPWYFTGQSIAGTLRLAARYKRDKSSQISYITILFLLNSATYLLYRVFDVPSQESFSAATTNIFQYLRGNAVTNVLIYATAATALQQWWIATQTSKKVSLSEPEVASLKLGYLFSCCAAIWLLFQTAGFAALNLVNRFLSIKHAELMLLGSWVLGLLFIAFISYKGRRLTPRELQSHIAVLLPLNLIIIQFISYVFPYVFELANGPRLQISALSCKLSNSSYLDVDAVVSNLTDTTLILKRSSITIYPYGFGGKLNLKVDRTFSEYTILDPQKAATLRLKSEMHGLPSDWRETRCGLEIIADKIWGLSKQREVTYTDESQF